MIKMVESEYEDSMDRKKDEDLMNLTFYNVYKRIEEYPLRNMIVLFCIEILDSK